MDNLLNKQREHFESISDLYLDSRTRNKNHLLLKSLIWNDFLRTIKIKKSKVSILEPMCGYAEGYEILSERFDCNYTGFDYSQKMVEFVKMNKPHLNVFCGDVTQVSLDKKFEIIIIIGGLHHVFAHVDQVLRKVHEHLADDGLFICFEPTQNNFIFKFIRNFIYKRNKLFDDQTEKGFDLSHLNKLLTDNGLTITSQIYPGLLSYVLYYNPDAFPLLNLGNTYIVKLLFSIDRLFFRNFIGRYFSFATLTASTKRRND